MCRILVADDDVEQVGFRRKLLEVSGHQVEVALNPVETMRQVRLGGTDLVIMDLRFPNAAGQPDSSVGLALIREIRESGCQKPLIVLSGWPNDLYGHPEERMVSRIMVKPVRAGTLVEAITSLVP